MIDCIHKIKDGSCSLFQDNDRQENPEGCDRFGFCTITSQYQWCSKKRQEGGGDDEEKGETEANFIRSKL